MILYIEKAVKVKDFTLVFTRVFCLPLVSQTESSTTPNSHHCFNMCLDAQLEQYFVFLIYISAFYNGMLTPKNTAQL